MARVAHTYLVQYILFGFALQVDTASHGPSHTMILVSLLHERRSLRGARHLTVRTGRQYTRWRVNNAALLTADSRLLLLQLLKQGRVLLSAMKFSFGWLAHCFLSGTEPQKGDVVLILVLLLIIHIVCAHTDGLR